MKDSVHKGHRERVRSNFLKNGFPDEMPLHNILEMLLFYSIPRKDTNTIAHDLVDRYGSLSNIFNAPSNELMTVPGININTVALFKLIIQIGRLYMTDKYDCSKKYNSIDDICNYLVCRYIGYDKEVFTLTTFNSGGRMLGFDILKTGDVCGVSISSREIIETVIRHNATCAIICHNHPGGLAVPSIEDVKLTSIVSDVLKTIGVRLLDHIIIADDDYVSLSQSHQYQHIFK